jgi:soluble lytic murein transglycosylase-like protein
MQQPTIPPSDRLAAVRENNGFQWLHFAVLVIAGLFVVAPFFLLVPPQAPAGLDWSKPVFQPVIITERIASVEPQNPNLPPAPAQTAAKGPETPYAALIEDASDRHGVDPDLVKAVISVESKFQKYAIGPQGALGLMQLMPQTAAALGLKNAFDPASNIDGGVRYLRDLLERYDGDLKLALAAYNAGVGNVAAFGGVPPFRTTRAYIQKVLHYHRFYQARPLEGGSYRQALPAG